MEAMLIHAVDYLWRQSWQIALLAVAVGGASWVLRNRSAHVRYLLWLLVLAKCLTPPLVHVPLAVLPGKPPPAIAPITPMIAQDVVLESPAHDRPLPPPSATPPPHRLSTRQWLALGWLAGVVTFVCCALTKAFRTILWLRRERRTLQRNSQDSIDRTVQSLAVSRPPRVWLIEGVGQPFVWGILRGDIYLPGTFARIEDHEHRRDILAHEVSHVLRFDAAVNSLQIIGQALFWFHPLVWWANRRIRREREKCCDEMAIARLGAEPKDYSAAIISTLTHAEKSIRPVPSLAVAGPVKNIEERIRTMLRPGKTFQIRPSLTVATIVILVALLTIPTTVVLTARAQTQLTRDGGDTIGQSLCHAARDGDLEQVKKLIAQGADVHATDREGLTPLYYAALRGHRQVAEFLAEKGANVNAMEPSYHFTPLHGAACNGHSDVVQFLVASGADVNARDKDGYTPLIHVIWNKDRNMADLFIACGAKLDVKDNDGWTAFRHAASQGSRDLIQLFAAKGTDGSSLHLAASAGNLSRVKRSLAEGANVDARDEFDWTPLYWAACTGHTETAEFLVARGADVNAKTKDARTPLHQAAQTGDAQLVRLLVSRDADVSAKDRHREQPIHNAASAEVVELLIAEGADVQARGGPLDMMPLHCAARHSRSGAVRSLIQKGADVNAMDKYGTVLHCAAMGGNPEVVDLLLSEGAGVNAKEKRFGRTPLHVAACMPGKPRIMELLIARGADVNSRDNSGQAPLHCACLNGGKDAAEFLIAKSADVNAKDNEGQTPLSLAKARGATEVTEMLRRHGAKE